MEPDHQFTRRKRTFHFPLSKPRWPGRRRFRSSAAPEPELSLLLSRSCPRKCADCARTNFERNVGAHQSALSFRRSRDQEKDDAFDYVRIFLSYYYQLTCD